MDEIPERVDRALAVRGLALIGTLVVALVGAVGFRVFDAAQRRDRRLAGPQSVPLATAPATAAVENLPLSAQPLAENKLPAADLSAAESLNPQDSLQAASYAEPDAETADDTPARSAKVKPLAPPPRFVAPSDAAVD